MKLKIQKKSNFSVILAGFALLVLITACATPPEIERAHKIPVVVFLISLPPNCVKCDEKSNTASMPPSCQQKMTECKINVGAMCNYLALLHAKEGYKGMRTLAEKTRRKVDCLLEGKND